MTLDRSALRKLASEATAAIRLALGCGEPTSAEAFYAAARTAVPDLLDQLDRAEAECAELRAAKDALVIIATRYTLMSDDYEAVIRMSYVGVEKRSTVTKEASPEGEEALAKHFKKHFADLDKPLTPERVEQRTVANAFNDMVGEREQLLAQLSAFRAALGEMTAARDEACDRLEAAWNRLYLKSEMAEVGDGGVDSLRSVGKAK